MTYLANIESFINVIEQFISGKISASEFVAVYFKERDQCLDDIHELYERAEKEVGVVLYPITDQIVFERDWKRVKGRVYQYEGFDLEASYPALDVVCNQVDQIYTASDCFWEESELGDDMTYDPPTVIDETMLLEEIKEKYAIIMSAIDQLQEIYDGKFFKLANRRGAS